jgi:hypothetical protein
MEYLSNCKRVDSVDLQYEFPENEMNLSKMVRKSSALNNPKLELDKEILYSQSSSMLNPPKDRVYLKLEFPYKVVYGTIPHKIQ